LKIYKIIFTLIVLLNIQCILKAQINCIVPQVTGNLELNENTHTTINNNFFVMNNNDLIASLTLDTTYQNGVINYALGTSWLSNYVEVNTTGIFTYFQNSAFSFYVDAIYGLDLDNDGLIDDLDDDCNTVFNASGIVFYTPVSIDWNYETIYCPEDQAILQYAFILNFPSFNAINYNDSLYPLNNIFCDYIYSINGDTSFCASHIQDSIYVYTYANQATGDSLFNNCIDSLYFEIIDTFGNAFTILEYPCAQVLGGGFCPIELLNFSAKQSSNKIEIKWQTATEFESDFFTLKKSYNAVNFENIATVKAAGTTSRKQSYSFIDDKIKDGHEIIYYQLTESALDGAEEDVATTFTQFNKVAQAKNFEIKNLLYDRNTNSLIFNYTGQVKQAAISIIDATGNIFYSKSFENSLSNMETILTLPNLKSNIYFIVISDKIKWKFEKGGKSILGMGNVQCCCRS